MSAATISPWGCHPDKSFTRLDIRPIIRLKSTVCSSSKVFNSFIYFLAKENSGKFKILFVSHLQPSLASWFVSISVTCSISSRMNIACTTFWRSVTGLTAILHWWDDIAAGLSPPSSRRRSDTCGFASLRTITSSTPVSGPCINSCPTLVRSRPIGTGGGGCSSSNDDLIFFLILT